MSSNLNLIDCENDQATGLGKLKEVRRRLLDSLKDGVPATKVCLSPDAPDTLMAAHTVYSRKSY